jgi:hypothetical protein
MTDPVGVRPRYVFVGVDGPILSRESQNRYVKNYGMWGLCDHFDEQGVHRVKECKGNTSLVGVQLYPATRAAAIECHEAEEESECCPFCKRPYPEEE